MVTGLPPAADGERFSLFSELKVGAAKSHRPLLADLGLDLRDCRDCRDCREPAEPPLPSGALPGLGRLRLLIQQRWETRLASQARTL